MLCMLLSELFVALWIVARSFFITRLRRSLGVRLAWEHARHRLRRMMFVGVPRERVRAWVRERDARAHEEPPVRHPLGGLGPDELYAHQQFVAPVAAAVVGG